MDSLKAWSLTRANYPSTFSLIQSGSSKREGRGGGGGGGWKAWDIADKGSGSKEPVSAGPPGLPRVFAARLGASGSSRVRDGPWRCLFWPQLAQGWPSSQVLSVAMSDYSKQLPGGEEATAALQRPSGKCLKGKPRTCHRGGQRVLQKLHLVGHGDSTAVTWDAGVS